MAAAIAREIVNDIVVGLHRNTPPWEQRSAADQQIAVAGARDILERLNSNVAERLRLLATDHHMVLEQISELVASLSTWRPDVVERCQEEGASLLETVRAVYGGEPSRIVLASSGDLQRETPR